MTRSRATWIAGAVALAGAVFLALRNAPNPDRKTPAAAAETAASPPAVRASKPARRPVDPLREKLPELPPPVESPFPSGSSESGDWMEDRIAELDRLSWFDDAESLAKILAELRNSQPEIRTAALAATVAFSSRDSIPYLETIARETRDPAEQKAIADAVEYLKLPTLVEELEKQPQPTAPPIEEEPEPGGSSGR